MLADPGFDPRQETRERYAHLLVIPTRLSDIDSHARVNSVVPFAYFDTLVNDYLIAEGGLDMTHGKTIGVVVETQCRFMRPLFFRQNVDAALRVAQLGKSSVRFEIALFASHEAQPAGVGHFVHVFVDRDSRKPVAMPPKIRAALERLIMPEP